MADKNNQAKTKSINLYCPSLSKMAQIMAWEDQRLDLGTIARTFGLEPSTLKLNGHFISRGLDLVASSVTWRSLLSFFSSKGLPTGAAGSGALVVDGKLSKAGTKRSHDPAVVENSVRGIKLCEKGVEVSKNPRHEDIKFPTIKKLKETSNVCENDGQKSKCSDTGLKRKHWLENVSPLKRFRVIRSNSNDISQDHEERGHIGSCATNLPCGYLLRENTKRMREDEALVAAASKRTR